MQLAWYICRSSRMGPRGPSHCLHLITPSNAYVASIGVGNGRGADQFEGLALNNRRSGLFLIVFLTQDNRNIPNQNRLPSHFLFQEHVSWDRKTLVYNVPKQNERHFYAMCGRRGRSTTAANTTPEYKLPTKLEDRQA